MLLHLQSSKCWVSLEVDDQRPLNLFFDNLCKTCKTEISNAGLSLMHNEPVSNKCLIFSASKWGFKGGPYLIFTQGNRLCSPCRFCEYFCLCGSSELKSFLFFQWFGNIVTMDWWDDLWLNEGFASFFEYIGVERAEPDWGMVSFL